MTLEKRYKNSKRQYYAIVDEKSNDIVRFDDLKTAAICFRYLQGAELSEYERETALKSFAEISER